MPSKRDSWDFDTSRATGGSDSLVNIMFDVYINFSPLKVLWYHCFSVRKLPGIPYVKNLSKTRYKFKIWSIEHSVFFGLPYWNSRLDIRKSVLSALFPIHIQDCRKIKKIGACLCFIKVDEVKRGVFNILKFDFQGWICDFFSVFGMVQIGSGSLPYSIKLSHFRIKATYAKFSPKHIEIYQNKLFTSVRLLRCEKFYVFCSSPSSRCDPVSNPVPHGLNLPYNSAV
jgi:hypothetical protein